MPIPWGSGVLDPGWAWEGEHQSGGVPCKRIWPVSQGTQGQPWLMPSKTSVMRAPLAKPSSLPHPPTNVIFWLKPFNWEIKSYVSNS